MATHGATFFNSPAALYELIKAIVEGQLTLNDFVSGLGRSMAEPFTYVYQHSYRVWREVPTDPEVYEYGKQLCEVLQTTVGALLTGGAAVAKLAEKLGKVAPRLARALEKAAEAAEAAETAYQITFKTSHAARHLKGTGLSAAEVESAISRAAEQTVKGASSVGPFWGRVTVQGQVIEFRAYPIGGMRINVGTYYPVGR